MDDATLMHRALTLALRGNGQTSPNPMVGAIVATPGGQVISSGWHERAGKPHAEIIALAAAGERARGATLFVNLEPCAHHGRTPPCADAIVKAGIARVVVAIEDPDPKVDGAGIARLRAAGIRVDVGTCRAEAASLNRAYLHHRKTGRPFVSLKMAASLDGAIAERAGRHRQVSGPRSAAFVRSLRISHDAVMVGVGTALVDDPQLTVRPPFVRCVPYTRIVVDSTGRIPRGSKLVKDQTQAQTVVACTAAMPQAVRRWLTAAGAKVLECAADGEGRVDLSDLLARLGDRGLLSVLCEGGPTLAARLLGAGLVNYVYWIAATKLFGTAAAAPSLSSERLLGVELHVESIRLLGNDVLIAATPSQSGKT